MKVVELEAKTVNGTQSGSNLQKSESESISEKSSGASLARKGKESLKKNVNNCVDTKVNKNTSSSMSDNSTSIDEELSCEIAIEHCSSDEEEDDPVPNIIKEYLGDASTLNKKTSLNINDDNSSSNNKIIHNNERRSKESSECNNRKKNDENLNHRKVTSKNEEDERLYKSLSPPSASDKRNVKIQPKYSKSHLAKSNYLDLKLTLTKKESITGVPVVHSIAYSRPRPASSLPRRPFYKHPQEKEVGRYPHSLKLLGVQIPDDASTGARLSRAFRSASSQSWIGTPAKIQTRVQRRSVSLDDVKRIIPLLKDPAHLKSTFLNEHQRAVLNQAIYEEWYDVRGKEIKRKKLKNKEEKEREEEGKKIMEEERKRRNEGVYNNWIKEKAKARTDKKPSENKTDLPKNAESEIKYSDSGAFESWKERKYTKTAERLKEKQEKEREKKMKAIMDKAEQRRKREDADKAFEAWLRMKKEKLKKQWHELQEYKIKLQEEELTRRHDAEIAFNFWKKKKEEEKSAKLDCYLSEPLSKERVITPSKIEEKNKLEAVLNSGHPPSYEEWLDYVEDREDSYMMQMGKIALECSMKPPWNPGGGTSAD